MRMSDWSSDVCSSDLSRWGNPDPIASVSATWHRGLRRFHRPPVRTILVPSADDREMSTMRWITLLFALACVLPLHAEDFQKCRSEGGATAYSGKGCLAGETLLAVIEPIADPPPVQRSEIGRASGRERVCQDGK